MDENIKILFFIFSTGIVGGTIGFVIDCLLNCKFNNNEDIEQQEKEKGD